MNVTMQITKTGTGVFVREDGAAYDLDMLDRAVEQLRVAQRWMVKDRAMCGLETKGA